MIAEFQYAYEIVKTKPIWVVIVVPPDRMEEARSILAVLANGRPFGGRTLALGEGRLSIAQSLDAVFVPPGQAFQVMFTGWDRNQAGGSEEMGKWRKASTGMVSRAA